MDYKTKAILATFISSISFSAFSNINPTRSLTIFNGDSSATGVSMYANGYMQARLRVNYNLLPDYTLEDITLRLRDGTKDGADLNPVSWGVSNIGNGIFENEIPPRRMNAYTNDEDQQYEDQQYEDQQYEDKQNEDKQNDLNTFNNTAVRYFFVSTKVRGLSGICVTLRARNKSEKIVSHSTCGSQAPSGAQVTLSALAPRVFTINDFFIEDTFERGPSYLLTRKYRLVPRNFRITMLNDAYQPTRVSTSKRLAATSERNSIPEIIPGVDTIWQSELFMDTRINQGSQTMQIPLILHSRQVGGSSSQITVLPNMQTPINTNNSINLWHTFGNGMANFRGWDNYRINMEVSRQSEFLSKIYFYDEYANLGEISISTNNDVDVLRMSGTYPAGALHRLGFSFM